jgi:hypothetical protein
MHLLFHSEGGDRVLIPAALAILGEHNGQVVLKDGPAGSWLTIRETMEEAMRMLQEAARFPPSETGVISIQLLEDKAAKDKAIDAELTNIEKRMGMRP